MTPDPRTVPKQCLSRLRRTVDPHVAKRVGFRLVVGVRRS